MLNLSLYQLTELMISWFLLIMGGSLLLQGQAWVGLARIWLNDPMHYMPSVYLYLLFGLFIVFTHNDWSMKPGLVITLTGWLLVIKSSIYMLRPDLFRHLVPRSNARLATIMRVAGVAYFLLGAWLVYVFQFS
jgi:hypothetical protein